MEHTQRDKVKQDEEHAATSQHKFVALACAVFERHIEMLNFDNCCAAGDCMWADEPNV